MLLEFSRIMIIDNLLLFGLLIAHVLQGSKPCMSGFPERDRLVSDVFSRSGPATRLIPEMRFVCNSTVVGYTVAMKRQNGDQYPVMQVWKESKTQSLVYHKVETDIPIDEVSCVDGFTELPCGINIFHCNLCEAFQLSVQPGDIFGFKLPSGKTASAIILFANIAKGPTNYVIEQQLPSSTILLSNHTSVNQELPQITVDIESDDCTLSRGFPHFPASLEKDGGGNSKTAVTILIPDMRSTCNGTLAGFTFTGINRQKGHQDPIIQIWRESSSQPSIFYRTGPAIAVNISDIAGVCDDGLPKIASKTFWCILKKDFQVSIQPGDILGLELPPISHDDFDIIFIRGGPTNYVFHQLNSSTVNLSSHDSVVQQTPQITFGLTSDQCTSGFLDIASLSGNGRRHGNSTKVTTRLFPDLRFGCSGTIVRIIVALVDRRGQQSPKLQIWRESKIESDVYYRHDHDIPVVDNSTVCIRHRLSGGLFRCTLNETFQVSVQPGDILGLELPPEDDDNFDIKFSFNAGGPLNYIFDGKLNSTANISEAARKSYDLPQINLVVMLGDSEPQVLPSCGNSLTLNTTQSCCSPVTNSWRVAIGPTIAVACFIFIVTIIVASVTLLRYKRKKYLSENNPNSSSHTIYSHVYQASSNYTAVANMTVPTETKKEQEYSVLTSDYDEIADRKMDTGADLSTEHDHYETAQFSTSYQECYTHNSEQREIFQPHMNNEDHEYHQLEMEQEQTSGENQTATVLSEEDDYWEPADSVNELYKQLCSKKYREIMREHVEIGGNLGSGQFGVVSKGVWESPKGALEVAVKQLQPGASEEDKVKFLQEAAVNGQFRHPNIVMLMGVVTVGEPTMIVLELLSNGDLRSFLIQLQYKPDQLTSTELKVDEQLLLKFCQHIASGMSYLASKSFVHRDLAARNILVSQDKICKISDFGMSRNVMDEDYYVSCGGKVPLKWTAPEAIHFKKYSTTSDVWSFGCVMYEIWSLGHKPFEEFSNTEVLKRVEKGYRLPPPPGTSKEIYRIMIECWQPESSRRPTFPQLVELLSRADFELFAWEEEDLRNSDPKVKIIGAPLETAKNLYRDLQRSYASEDYN